MINEITLTTPYFHAGTDPRQLELDECLRANIANVDISKIILLVDDGHRPPFASNKVEIIDVIGRPTYADWLTISLEKSVQGVSVLANSDIYFDKTISSFHETLKDKSTLVALSRWEVEAGRTTAHPNPQWSQDVWAISMNSEITERLLMRLDIELGVPRCDNKVAYVFATEGWGVRNPYHQVKSMHLHESGLRAYSKRGDSRLLGGVAYVYPSDGMHKDSRLHIDIWSLKAHNVVEVSFNSNLHKWKAEDELVLAAKKVHASDPNEELKRKLKILKNGAKTLSIAAEYAVYEYGGEALLVTGIDASRWVVLDKSSADETEILLGGLVRPILGGLPCIKDSSATPDDVYFWQYPCWTEKQAFENHAHMRAGRNVDAENKVVNVYLPLPWATFVDKKVVPQDLVQLVAKKVRLAQDLVKSFGYSLKVHTVCQHIHWRRLLDDMMWMGINAMSISHCERITPKEIREAGLDLKVRPWTLYAVNYANKARSNGLEPGKPMSQRKYLASFIGAHMAHYRSNIRVKLYEGLSALMREDVLVDLGDTWHFNKIVYNEQVANDKLAEQDVQSEEDSTLRYNQVLTDSKFALCPDGAGPNTLRFWEAIAVGSIPVLFDQQLQFPWKVEAAIYENCLLWKGTEIGEEFCEWLDAFSDEELQEKSDQLQKIYRVVEPLTCF